MSRIQTSDDEFPDSLYRNAFEIWQRTIHQFVLQNSLVELRAASFGYWEDGALEVLDAAFTLGNISQKLPISEKIFKVGVKQNHGIKIGSGATWADSPAGQLDFLCRRFLV